MSNGSATVDLLKPRAFHGDDTSYYPLPNDGRETERLTKQHDALVGMMHGEPIHAPLDFSKVKKIFDIGCGVNADMTRLLAQKFPGAKVFGIDLSPISPEISVPTNVEFVHGNIITLAAKEPALAPGTVDYAYSRYLVAGMADWRPWIKDTVAPLLAAGGWIEIQDLDSLHWFNASGERVSDNWKWAQDFSKWREERGMKFYQLQTDEISDILQEAGLINIERKDYRLPWAPVPGKPETELYAKYAPEMRHVYISALQHVYPGEENAHVREDALQDIWQTLKPREGMYHPMTVVWARKPL